MLNLGANHIMPFLTAPLTLASTLVVSTASLLVADEIPGWTDLSALAKVSVISFLCLLIGVVVIQLLRTLREQQKEFAQAAAEQRQMFMDEVSAARDDYGTVVDKIQERSDKRVEILHQDMSSVVHAIGNLALQCERARASMLLQCSQRHSPEESA